MLVVNMHSILLFLYFSIKTVVVFIVLFYP